MTLIAPRPATGELTFVYLEEAAARAGRELHRAASAFTVTDTEHPTFGMTYILGTGGTRLEQSPETQKAWKLVVSFREVLP